MLDWGAGSGCRVEVPHQGATPGCYTGRTGATSPINSPSLPRECRTQTSCARVPSQPGGRAPPDDRPTGGPLHGWGVPGMDRGAPAPMASTGHTVSCPRSRHRVGDRPPKSTSRVTWGQSWKLLPRGGGTQPPVPTAPIQAPKHPQTREHPSIPKCRSWPPWGSAGWGRSEWHRGAAGTGTRRGPSPLPPRILAGLWGGLGVLSVAEALSCGKAAPLQPYARRRAPASLGGGPRLQPCARAPVPPREMLALGRLQTACPGGRAPRPRRCTGGAGGTGSARCCLHTRRYPSSED